MFVQKAHTKVSGPLLATGATQVRVIEEKLFFIGLSWVTTHCKLMFGMNNICKVLNKIKIAINMEIGRTVTGYAFVQLYLGLLKWVQLNLQINEFFFSELAIVWYYSVCLSGGTYVYMHVRKCDRVAWCHTRSPYSVRGTWKAKVYMSWMSERQLGSAPRWLIAN